MTTMTSTPRPVRGSHHSFGEEGGARREQASSQKHVSVMVQEVLDALALTSGEIVIDATYGQGGHTKALKRAAKVHMVSLDADPAVGEEVVEANFADIKAVAKRVGISSVNKILFDLGWNRGQLSSGRGFSFLHDEPLVMSYGTTPRSGFTAAEILNTWSEKVLADVLYGYGEERYARRIAQAIVARREVQPFATTLELVEVVRDSVPAAYRRGKTHPATKTFQALRIATNDELGAIAQGIAGAWELLSCGGRIAVITFHSIEDRLVKRLFAALVKKEEGKLLYKKPLTPSAAELKANPSARSAKLRAIEKICEA